MACKRLKSTGNVCVLIRRCFCIIIRAVKTHLEIIALWPGARYLAEDIGQAPITVRRWRSMGRIAPRSYDAILEAAQRRGFDLTYAELAAGGK